MIADTVTFEGTVRTYRPETKEKVKQQFHSMVKGVTEAMGAKPTIEYFDGYPAMVNHAVWAERIKQTSQQVLGDTSTPLDENALPLGMKLMAQVAIDTLYQLEEREGEN